jgi:hypothetical protein
MTPQMKILLGLSIIPMAKVILRRKIVIGLLIVPMMMLGH